MLIKKVKNTIAVVAKVVQNLTNNNETDVPSVKAVNNAMNEKIGVKMLVLDTALENTQSYQNDLLKDAKIVIVNWKNTGGWNMQTIHVCDGYSLNTYGTTSCGSTFSSNSGTITYTYSSNTTEMKIAQICILK